MTSGTKLKIKFFGLCWSVGLILCVAAAFVFGGPDLVHKKCPQASFYRNGYLRFEKRTGKGEIGALVCDRCDFEIKIVPNE